LRIRIDLKVFIADIAPADKSDRVVDNQQLVVHAVVEARCVERKFSSAKHLGVPSIHEWIEYPDLDLRMRLERRNLLVALERVAIIDQHAHAHSAIGSVKQRAGQQLAGLILTEDEILEVESALRSMYHLRPS
jgi:hypothetical protein